MTHHRFFTLHLLFLWVSVLLFSAANSVIAKLGEIGANHLIDGRNPISFCNVLFTANIIAGITLLAIHHRKWNRKNLSKLTPGNWGSMLVLAVLSGVIGPTLFFLGLMLTEVINVVLLSVFDIPLTLFFAYLLIGEKPKWGTWIAASLVVIGIIITFFLHTPSMSEEMKMTMINIGEGPIAHFLATLPKAGEICIILATLFTVFSVELSRKTLKEVPVGIYSVFRMIVGAILFFVIVLIMLGWVHFIDIFDPFLLEWMAFYGIAIIGFGLYLWHKGIHATSSADFAIVNAFTPIAGIFFAYIILGEIPEFGQILGGVIILVGIAVGLISKLKKDKMQKKFKKPRSFSGV